MNRSGFFRFNSCSAFFLILSLFISTQGFTYEGDSDLRVKLAHEIVERATRNLELNHEIYAQPDKLFLLEAEMQVIFASMALQQDDTAVFPELYHFEEAVFLVALRFERFDAAKTILLEFRRNTDNPVKLKWIEAELFRLEKSEFLKNTRRSIPPSDATFFYLEKSEEDPFLYQLRVEAGLNPAYHLFSESCEDLNALHVARTARFLEGEALYHFDKRQYGLTASCIDRAAILYASLHDNENEKIGHSVWAARYLRDLGLTLQAIVRFKILHSKLSVPGREKWCGIVAEDLAHIYSSMGMIQNAFKCYDDALRAYSDIDYQEGLERVAGKTSELF